MLSNASIFEKVDVGADLRVYSQGVPSDKVAKSA